MDAFDDLAWSKPAVQPATLGSLSSKSSPSNLLKPSPATLNANKPYDAFSRLAATSGPSSYVSRTPSPSFGNSLPTTAASKSGLNGSGDAFSSLVGFGNGSSSNTSTMSMAERQKLSQQQTTLGSRTTTTAPKADAMWDQLDLVAGFGGSKPQAPAVKLAPTAAKKAPALADPWDLDPLAPTIAQPAVQQKRQPASSTGSDLLGFDDFAAPSTQPSNLGDADDDGWGMFVAKKALRPVNGFDDEDVDGGDDILGLLGRPTQADPPRAAPPPSRSPAPAGTRGGHSNGRASPPPHILGQIVEMGFSIAQARAALAATDSGVDVAAALDTLLNAPAAESAIRGDRGRDRPDPRAGFRDEADDEEEERRRADAEAERRRKRRAGPSRQQAPPPQSTDAAAEESASALQADKLLAQASGIGMNMLKTANMFWSQGKERVQKAYEERMAASTAGASTSRGSGASTPADGRPRWMIDAMEAGAIKEDELRSGFKDDLPSPKGGAFEDDDDDVQEAPSFATRQPNQAGPPQRQAQPGPRKEPSAPPQPSQPIQSARRLIFDDQAPAAGYVSPARRRGTPAPATASTSSTPQRSRTPPKPKPAPIPRTPLPTSAQSLKEQGTASFKLGQFAAASEHYSAALSSLPFSFGGFERAVLLSNRAAARVKTGEMRGAVDDCAACLAILDDEGDGPDEKALRVKVLARRAGAWEGMEKWSDAMKDWESVLSAGGAGGSDGAARCRKMLSGGSSAGSSSSAPPPARPKPKARPAPRPTPAAAAGSSEAVSRLRDANASLEAEEQARHDLKDAIDGRLLAWKGGKETNLRALIASLENVLWPELGWVKVGMHELVTPSQVKIRYTKAIARVHPDKLTPSNTTLEQRMIANGVFGALNEAWLAFKQ